MHSKRLLGVLLGSRLLVPPAFACALTDAGSPPSRREVPHEHATAAGGDATSHRHVAPHVHAAHQHAPAAPAENAGHCNDASSSAHACHGDGDACTCVLQFVAHVPAPAAELDVQHAKLVPFAAIEPPVAPVCDAIQPRTRAGPAPPHPARPFPSLSLDATRAPPALA